MSLASAVIARRMRLVRAHTRAVDCVRDLAVPMADGAVLLADRWVARADRDRPQPTVLLRSPYGRRRIVGLVFGRLLAERGFQVVIQSCRGTFGSQGEFNPFDERADGLATLDWLRAQEWHEGPIGMMGPSYLGLVQWAVAPDAGDDLAALAVQVSASQFHGQTYAGGSLSLETAASWLVLVAEQERRLAPIAMARALRRLPALFSAEDVPLAEFDTRATGKPVRWFQEALASPGRESPYWVSRDFAAGVAQVTAPVQLVGGWYDIFLPWMLEDYMSLRAAGRTAEVVIGPWTHTAPGLLAAGHREAMAWLRAHVLGDDRRARRAPVRVRMTGDRTPRPWREFDAWPPPGTGERRLWLAPDGRLREDGPVPGPAGDRYRYDPADPTPSLGGPVLLARAPVLDNRVLEARPDVLTYTTPPLPAAVEAIGPVRVELFVRASAPWFDVFARVCDVDSVGGSWNVCDALARNTAEAGPDGVHRVAFDLWPMGHRFAAGHAIRLQISSGAYPRYARNPGTGEDIASASALRAVDLEVLHGEAHPSAVVLPRRPD